MKSISSLSLLTRAPLTPALRLGRSLLSPVAVGAALLLAACGGEDGGGGNESSKMTGGTAGAPSMTTGGSAGSGGSDTGGSDTGGSDTGGGGSGGTATELPMPETCGPEASLNADGILSPYPNIEVALYPAEDYSLVSFNLSSHEDGDDRGPLLKFYAELRNDSTELRCFFLPDVYLGFEELVTLVDGDQFYQDYGSFIASTTTECIAPGETGIMYGVQRGITTEDLEAATFLEISPESNDFNTDFITAVEPVISDTEVIEKDDGYALTGTVTYLEDIYNQKITVYPRDARGLIVDDILAFPGDLASHFAGTSTTFETEATECRFEDFEVYQSWISEEN